MRARTDADFEARLREGQETAVEGWDFSRFGDRYRETPLPWDFDALAESAASATSSMLDMGTGGGEWLAQRRARPAHTVATESWVPNVPVAHARLTPLDIPVVQAEDAAENHSPETLSPAQGRLPFADQALELVTNRHESYNPREVHRVLAPGGAFLTQQVGGDNDTGLRAALGLPSTAAAWAEDVAAAQLRCAGFDVADSGTAHPETALADVAVLVWYLRVAPWMVPEFTVGRFRRRLLTLHRQGPLRVTQSRFWVRARKP